MNGYAFAPWHDGRTVHVPDAAFRFGVNRSPNRYSARFPSRDSPHSTGFSSYYEMSIGQSVCRERTLGGGGSRSSSSSSDGERNSIKFNCSLETQNRRASAVPSICRRAMLEIRSSAKTRAVARDDEQRRLIQQSFSRAAL